MVQTAQIGRKLARKRWRKTIGTAALRPLLTSVQPAAQIGEVGALGALSTQKSVLSRPFPDAENRALIALLQEWREEDAAMSEEEADQADRDLADFKANMNANRAATGESPVYR